MRDPWKCGLRSALSGDPLGREKFDAGWWLEFALPLADPQVTAMLDHRIQRDGMIRFSKVFNPLEAE